ncbi:MAG: NupC/NupG family nucleoside CNT transporter [Proteobacteria bacterium]|nr:NupC/NupG family nucleoside CNT transporter [Pseudomonadota bacterium]
MSGNLIGLAGIAVILGAAVLFSGNRKAINFRIVGAAFALQVVIAFCVLYFDWGKLAIQKISGGVQAVIDYSGEGIAMVFGPLANASEGVIFAVHVLPVIIFFAALMSVLYHLRIMQWIVKLVGGGLRKVIGAGPIESMNAAANIFVGQTEAPLVVRPYLRGLTEPQFFAVMVSGVASVAGTVLAAYVLMGAEMNYLLAASFMAAPGGLLMAKIIMPDDPADLVKSADTSFVMEESKHVNVILAAAVGSADGLRLAVNIGAMLIAFVALIALFNGVIGGLFSLVGIDGVTLQLLLGKIFQPLMYVLSVPWHEAEAAGALFGEKLILNEFVAFSHMGEYLAGMSERTRAVVTFSLCGFANLSSIAILLGGLGVLVPEKKDLIARFGLKAVAAGSLSNLMSAALAGLLLTF